LWPQSNKPMAFTARTIRLEETGQFSKLFIDYLHQAPALQPFYTHAPNAAGYAAALNALQYEEKNRSILVQALHEQYAHAGMAAPEDLMQTLAQTETRTVTTGHQLCLFTGPLYFVTKIASTIRLAETLAATHQHSIVPIYWMASEDHDVEEIRALRVYGKTLRWETTQTGPTGLLQTTDLTDLLAELRQILGTTPAAEAWMKTIELCYVDAPNLAVATRRLVHALFGNRVLVLDSNSPALKKTFVSFLKTDLWQHTAEANVRQTMQELAALGYEAQVNPRTINVFYMRDGMRERMEREGVTWRVLNTELVFSETALEEELQNHPERFSPNVVLRPLYQQCILPNLAYVGGPGELAYWLEYRRFFETQNVFFPVLHPRFFSVFADAGSLEKLEKKNLGLTDLFRHPDELARALVLRESGDQVHLENEKAALEKMYAAIAARLAAIDPTLKAAAEGEGQKVKNGLAALESKMIRAEKQKQEVVLNQVKKIRDKILPEGALQERKDNFLPYAIDYGDHFITDLIAAIDSFNQNLNVLIKE
jgi:bacillithiol synthase